MKTTIGAIKTAIKAALKATEAKSCELVCNAGTMEVVAHSVQGFIKVTLDSQGKLEDASAEIGGKVATAILGNMADDTEVSIKATEAGMTLRFGGASIKLRRPEQERIEDLFEKTISCTDKRLIAVDKASAFVAMLRAPTTFAAKNDVRYYLCGVFLTAENSLMRAVGTNGQFLQHTTSSISVKDDFAECIVPAVVANEFGNVFKGDADVSLYQTGKGDSSNIILQSERVKWVSRLVSGTFPSYKRILPPPYPFAVTVSKDALVGAIERVKAPADDTYIRLIFKPDQLVVQSPDGEQCEVFSLETGVEKKLTVGFTAELLANALATVESKELVLSFTDDSEENGVKPITIKPTSMNNYEDWLAVVMPARI